MSGTTIEWTRGDDGALGAVWNPTRGCSRVSEGCGSARGGGCYAERQAIRFAAPGQPYEGLVKSTPSGPRWTGVVKLVPEMLAAPLRWKKPRRVFVNSMSDLFHEALSNEDIAAVFGVMAKAYWHVYQVLTKRPARMREWFAWAAGGRHVYEEAQKHTWPGWAMDDVNAGNCPDGWPRRNIWLGVSVEDQATADARIPELLATPAAVRFISYEPAIAWANLRGHFLSSERTAACVCGHGHGFTRCPNTGGVANPCHHRANGCACKGFQRIAGEGISWCIVGGESGPNARPFDLAWARQTIAACKAAGVACFVKQVSGRPYVANANEWDWPDGVRLVHDGEHCASARAILRDRKGGDMSEWPEDLRARCFPGTF